MTEMLNQKLEDTLLISPSNRKWRYYSKHRDSGIDWLDQIPKHWKTSRLRFACKINPPKSELSHISVETQVSFLPMENIGEDGTLSLDEIRTIEQVSQGYTYFRDGDVILAKITPCFENGKGALCEHLINGIGFGTTELHVLRARDQLLPSFLAYMVKSNSLRTLGKASMYGSAGQQRVSEDFISNFRIALPPLVEQHVIASFLDRETAKIDELITKKEQLIHLLLEKRAALISRAVTKGLNPDASMKDSGVEWLEEIPEHWEVRRLKFVTSFITSGSRGWAQYYSDEGAAFLRIGNLSRTTIDLDMEGIQYVSPPRGTEGERTRVRPNDILISITAYIGSVAVAPKDIGEAYVNQHIALTRPLENGVNPRWLGYCLYSGVGQDQFRVQLNGGTKDGLGLEDVANLVILLPPLHEQDAIVAYLDNAATKIDALISRIRDGIKKLQEYRTALISAAVTGKIDVREEQAIIDEVEGVAD